MFAEKRLLKLFEPFYGLCLAKKSQNTVCKSSATTCSVLAARYQLSKSEHARKAKFWDSPARLFPFAFSIYCRLISLFLPRFIFLSLDIYHANVISVGKCFRNTFWTLGYVGRNWSLIMALDLYWNFWVKLNFFFFFGVYHKTCSFGFMVWKIPFCCTS